MFKTDTLITQVIVGQPEKDGVFVTLCAPLVIKKHRFEILNSDLYNVIRHIVSLLYNFIGHINSFLSRSTQESGLLDKKEEKKPKIKATQKADKKPIRDEKRNRKEINK